MRFLVESTTIGLENLKTRGCRMGCGAAEHGRGNLEEENMNTVEAGNVEAAPDGTRERHGRDIIAQAQDEWQI